MIFAARRQSFKILSIAFILFGSMFVDNCRAEKNPVSLDRQSLYQELVGSEGAVQLEMAKQNRKRTEESWSKFKLFASQHAMAGKQALVSLDLKSWRNRLSGLNVLPAMQIPLTEVAEARTISLTAMGANYLANMTALQWWQASEMTADLVERGQQRVAQVASNVKAELQVDLMQLVEQTSNSVVLLANGLGGEVLPALSVTENHGSRGSLRAESIEADLSHVNLPSNDSLETSVSSDDDPTADPYWQYYSDCDFWGAQFESVEE